MFLFLSCAEDGSKRLATGSMWPHRLVAGGLLVQTKDGPKNNSRRHVVFYIVLLSFGLFLSNHCDSAEGIIAAGALCTQLARFIHIYLGTGDEWTTVSGISAVQISAGFFQTDATDVVWKFHEVPRQSCCLFGSTLHGSMPKPLRSEPSWKMSACDLRTSFFKLFLRRTRWRW